MSLALINRYRRGLCASSTPVLFSPRSGILVAVSLPLWVQAQPPPEHPPHDQKVILAQSAGPHAPSPASDTGSPPTIAKPGASLRANLLKLFPELIATAEGGNDEQLYQQYKPHLRDISPEVSRSAHLYVRSQAGELSGGSEDACTNAKRWAEFPHETPTCCGVDTTKYAALREDHSFKTCCVRQDEAELSEEEIACRHPDGTGWAGLFEFYFPTQVIHWGSTDGTSLLLDPNELAQCVNDSAALRKLEMRVGVDDVTMRVNGATMAQSHREDLARRLCMHPSQFLKLMDPDPDEDPYQKLPEGKGVASDDMLRAIPIWSTLCPFGVALLSSESESAKLTNFDQPFYTEVGGRAERATDLALGYERGFRRDPLYCRAGSSATKQVATPDPLAHAVDQLAGSGQFRAADIGYSCREERDVGVPMSPVVKPASLRQESGLGMGRESFAMAFAIAGAVYAPLMAEETIRRSYYKRFEPLAYYTFTGKRFTGGRGVNEQGVECVVARGGDQKPEKEQGKVQREVSSDLWHVSNNVDNGHYVAQMRIFATCPKGWVRWRGEHSELACGEEKLW